MENLILGLLMLSPMSGYELQQFIKQNLSLICSHSAGSVQTALYKLEREGKVSARQVAQDRRHKKIFSITQPGRDTFASWVAQPMQADRSKKMELAHLFFLGLAKPGERAAAIREYLHQLEQIQQVLCVIRERFEAICQEQLPSGQSWEEIARFQGYTIEYGIAAAQFERDWFGRLLGELEETR